MLKVLHNSNVMRIFVLSKVKQLKTNKIMEDYTNTLNKEYPTSSTWVNNTLLAQVVCETMLNKYTNRFFAELKYHGCITPTVKDIKVIGANKVETIFNDGDKLTETIHQFYKGSVRNENYNKFLLNDFRDIINEWIYADLLDYLRQAYATALYKDYRKGFGLKNLPREYRNVFDKYAKMALINKKYLIKEFDRIYYNGTAEGIVTSLFQHLLYETEDYDALHRAVWEKPVEMIGAFADDNVYKDFIKYFKELEEDYRKGREIGEQFLKERERLLKEKQAQALANEQNK